MGENLQLTIEESINDLSGSIQRLTTSLSEIKLDTQVAEVN
jgi:hypothetical protein